MSIVSVGAFAIAAVVIILTLKPKNAEIALMLGLAASAIIMINLLSYAAEITQTVNGIIAASGISTGYIVILFKVIGICLVTEFAANTCRDAGSQSLAGNVTLTGKILVTVAALPLYSDILNTVLELLKKT